MKPLKRPSDLAPVEPLTRRRFIANSGASVLGATLISAELLDSSQTNSKIVIGLIGCGGRGKWIADLIHKGDVSNAPYRKVCAAI